MSQNTNMQKYDANMQETHLQPPVARPDTPAPKSTPPPNRVGTFANDTETVKMTDLNGAFTGLRFPKHLLVYFSRWEEYAEKFYELDSNIDIGNTRIKKDKEMWNAWEKGEGHPKMTGKEKSALQEWKKRIDKKEAIGLSEIWDLARGKVAFEPLLWSMGYRADGGKSLRVSKEEIKENNIRVDADVETWLKVSNVRGCKKWVDEMNKAKRAKDRGTK